MDVSENSVTPKSSILIGFSIINHPFWGTPIFGNTHINYFNILAPHIFPCLTWVAGNFTRIIPILGRCMAERWRPSAENSWRSEKNNHSAINNHQYIQQNPLVYQFMI